MIEEIIKSWTKWKDWETSIILNRKEKHPIKNCVMNWVYNINLVGP
jgi:hypothetical protein